MGSRDEKLMDVSADVLEVDKRTISVKERSDEKSEADGLNPVCIRFRPFEEWLRTPVRRNLPSS